MNKLARVLYRLTALICTAIGARVGRKSFDAIWRHGGNRNADPRNRAATWGPVLIAAALQGAIQATVQAAARRGSASGVAMVTGTWPGPINSGPINSMHHDSDNKPAVPTPSRPARRVLAS